MGSRTAPPAYLGSKRRQVDEIVSLVHEASNGPMAVLDLFSGTGSVSRGFADRGDSATSVDVQEYARVLSSALTMGAREAAEIDPIAIADSIDRERASGESLYGSLFEYEEKACADVADDDFAALCDITEFGTLHPAYGQAQRPKALAGRIAGIGRNPYENDLVLCYFGGTYFSYRQAFELDAICKSASRCTPNAKDLVLAAGIIAASKACANVGGQLAQPPKLRSGNGTPKKATCRKVAKARSVSVADEFDLALAGLIDDAQRRRSCGRAVKAPVDDYLDACGRFDAIYADPPYSRYHYSRYYHVYETMCLYDWPDISSNPATRKPSRGIYRENRYQSGFSTRMGAPREFAGLLDRAAAKTNLFVLSYSPYPDNAESTPRMVTVNWLEEQARERFKSVRVLSTECGIAHSKLNTRERQLATAEDAEVYLICES